MTTTARSCPACRTPLPEEAHFCLHCGTATPTEPGVPPRTLATGPVEVSRVRNALADRYRVERVLGEGGMATVYLAEDLKHRRKVALKVMRPELAATLGADRFLREVEIAGRLSHPHILPMHDSGEAQGILYYVMPYIDGESLRDRIRREGQLPVEDALRLARETLEALAYAHGNGIVHRDMKPANIMLSAGHALVADFGIARAVGKGEGITQTGTAIGTPQYMSPEQATGDRDVDGRTDVYAVGAMLYEMLAGEPPFTGPTSQAIITRSLLETARPLSATRAGLSPAIESAVSKAMAKSAADRYQTADAFARALQQAQEEGHRVAPAQAEAVSPALVWGLFGAGALVGMIVVFALIARWGLPQWTLGLAIGLLVIGAVVVVATGRVEARRRSGTAVRGLARRLTYRNAAIGGGLALALWGAVALGMLVRGPGSGGATAAAADGIRLAVLPFENRGDPADAYLADGIADEMRGKLAGLGGFQITARTSSEQYRSSTKTPQQIGQELGVRYLLTATVRWAKSGSGTSRVQVQPELIDVRTGGVTWQQSFDADLTDVFQVQTQIASRVAGALGVALGTQDQERLTERPTENLAAWDLYLKARAVTGGDAASLRLAIQHFEQAVALDSSFVQAWANLGSKLAILYNNSTPDPAVGARALAAAERAIRLDPKSADAHNALIVHSMVVAKDHARARQLLEVALRDAPNDPPLLSRAANLEKSSGRWEEALLHLQQARRLDPRSLAVANNLQNTLMWMRRYPEALAASEAALAIAPGDLSVSQDKAMIFVAQGDLAGARAVIKQVSPTVPAPALAGFFALYWDMYWVLDEDLQQVLLRLGPSAFDDDRTAWGAALMQTWWARGDRVKARAYADSALVSSMATLAKTPDDPQRNALHGLILGYLGRKAEAIAAGERAISISPVGRDGVNGPYMQHQLARTYLLVGEPERALDMLEPLLKVPYYLSPGWLRIDPTFAELKGNPRYDRLVRGS